MHRGCCFHTYFMPPQPPTSSFPNMHVTHLESALDGTRYEADERFADRATDPETVASSLRVPEAVGDFMILDTLRESNGRAVAVDESRIREWMRLGTSTTGVSIGPQAAACVGATDTLSDEGWIADDDRVVLFNCGAAQKYPHTLNLDLPRLAPDESIDWDDLAAYPGLQPSTPENQNRV